MPIIYRCKNCGYILYVFLKVGQDDYGVPTPSEISSWYGGRCPKCGSPIGDIKPSFKDVIIRPMRKGKMNEIIEEIKKSEFLNLYVKLKIEDVIKSINED